MEDNTISYFLKQPLSHNSPKCRAQYHDKDMFVITEYLNAGLMLSVAISYIPKLKDEHILHYMHVIFSLPNAI